MQAAGGTGRSHTRDLIPANLYTSRDDLSQGAANCDVAASRSREVPAPGAAVVSNANRVE